MQRPAIDIKSDAEVVKDQVYKHPTMTRRGDFVDKLERIERLVSTQALTFDDVLDAIANCEIGFKGKSVSLRTVTEFERVTKQAVADVASRPPQELIHLVLRILSTLLGTIPQVRADFVVESPYTQTEVSKALLKAYPFAAQAVRNVPAVDGRAEDHKLTPDEIRTYVNRVNRRLLQYHEHGTSFPNDYDSNHHKEPRRFGTFSMWAPPRATASVRMDQDRQRNIFTLYLTYKTYNLQNANKVPTVRSHENCYLRLRTSKREWPWGSQREGLSIHHCIPDLLRIVETLHIHSHHVRPDNARPVVAFLQEWAAAAVSSSCVFAISDSIFLRSSFADIAI